MKQLLPILQWAETYSKNMFAADFMAAIIVTIMLIPQSLAYALLAGVPAHVGLYASILPLVAYAIFGTSRTLSVGPVAVASLMTAASLAPFAAVGSAEYLAAAIVLALLSGVFLLLLGFLRLGFMANLLSHPVVSGFITASAVLIAFSQFKHLLGIEMQGQTLLELGGSLLSNGSGSSLLTFVLGSAVIAFLLWSREGAVKLLVRCGVSESFAPVLAKAAPIVGVLSTILLTAIFGLEQRGLAVVGSIPAGLPSLLLPQLSSGLMQQLMVPAIMISIIGYVESVSVGKTLAAKKRQRIDVNQELIALGAANVASAISGAFPVTGGFSRSVVNFDAGAATQAASIMTAVGIAMASLFLTPALYYLPKATLAATIIVAVLSLIDLDVLGRTWRYAKSDFAAVVATIVITLTYGVEAGVAAGVITSIALHLYRTSVPHIAEVGLLAGTEHFRNVRRFKVETTPEICCLRVDQSLFFANAHHLEARIYETVFQRDRVAHVILQCSAINEIDSSALEILEAINQSLCEQGISLHFSEIKGPVMDALHHSDFLHEVSGEIFLTQFEAYTAVKAMI